VCVCVWEGERQRERKRESVCACVCMCVCVCVYVYTCIHIYVHKERERERVCVREREREKERKRAGERVRWCLCVWERQNTFSIFSRFPVPMQSRNDFNEPSHIYKENAFYISSPWIYSVTHICNVTRMQREHLLYFRSLDVSIYPRERWGAGVETHFQEISWNLRPVVNGT